MSIVSKVTRTIKATEAVFLCIDVNTAEPYNQQVVLPGVYKNNEAIEKAGKEIIDNEEKRVCAVVSATVTEKLYAMTEADFVAHATVIPARKQKTEATAEN